MAELSTFPHTGNEGMNHVINETQCCVCGKTSSGVHYGVRSCEGCKAFYKRAMMQRAKYNCYFGGNCFGGIKNSRATIHCKSCRLKRCSEAGMDLTGTKWSKSTRNAASGRKLIKDNLQNSPSHRPDDLLHLQNTSHCQTDVPGTLAVIRYSSSHKLKQNLNGSSKQAMCRPFQFLERFSQQERFQPQASYLTLDPAVLDTGCFLSPTLRERLGGFKETFCHFATSNAGLKVQLTNSFLKRPVLDTHISGLAGKMPEISVGRFPTFLANYWGSVSEKSRVLLETVRAVDAAVDAAYGDQLKKWHRFMERAFLYDEIPYQPQTSLKGMMETFQYNITDIGKRLSNFALLLPGFTELSPTSQQFVLRHRWSECWFMHQAFFVRNGTYYNLVGPNDFHYSRYWMDIILENVFVEYCVNLMEEFNQLNLNMTETYLLMAVHLTDVQPTDLLEERDRKHLSHLNFYYSDALCSLIGSRRFLSASAGVLEKLHPVMERLKSFRKVDKFYISALDVTQLPFRPVRGSLGISTVEFFASLSNH